MFFYTKNKKCQEFLYGLQNVTMTLFCLNIIFYSKSNGAHKNKSYINVRPYQSNAKKKTPLGSRVKNVKGEEWTKPSKES